MDFLVKILLKVVNFVGKLLDYFVDFVNAKVRLLIWGLVTGTSGMISSLFTISFLLLSVFDHHMIGF